MIIGYDGKRAVFNNTGLGNYSRLLVEVMATAFPENEYRLYTPRMERNGRLAPLLERPNVSLVGPESARHKAFPALWRLSAMGTQMCRQGAQLIHGLSGELPLGVGSLPVPSVVTMHDVIFRRHPQWYKPVDRAIYDFKFRKAARAATRILAISKCTARDVVELYGVDPGKIDVVYQGCDSQFHRTPSAQEADEVKRLYGIAAPYVVAVGSIEERKNQMLALRGLRGLPDDIHLVIAGRRTPYAAQLEAEAQRLGLADRLTILDKVAFAHLPALYAGALFSSYTSRYEGFGIPVIESLSVGTPVIVATGSCLEEAGGPDTPAVDPDNADQWIAEARRLVESPELRAAVADAGRRYVTRFSDESMARGTMECYTRAIRDFSR